MKMHYVVYEMAAILSRERYDSRLQPHLPVQWVIFVTHLCVNKLGQVCLFDAMTLSKLNLIFLSIGTENTIG